MACTRNTYNPSGVGVFGVEHPDYAPPQPPRRRRSSEPAWRSDPASTTQLAFIETLMKDRQLDDLQAVTLPAELQRGITKGRASDLITDLKAAPRATGTAAPVAAAATSSEPAAEGVYEKGGTFYAVRTARNSDRRYAYEAIISDTSVSFEFAKGAVYRLADARRLDVEEIEALSLQFSRCFLCGRTLTAKDSKARGIGPVCRKKVEFVG